MNFDLNPNSANAKFAEILARLGGQDEVLKSILQQSIKTNGRVSSAEAFRAVMYVLGALGMLVLGAVATAVATTFSARRE